MSSLKLFVDKISHPSRFCIQFLKLNRIPYQEINLKLMKGENKNHPDLPFGQIPVLKVDGKWTISQSTTILRYLADTNPQIGTDFYPKDVQGQAKVNEFMDFFHFSMNAPLVRAIQNKAFYKLLFKLSEPKHEIINESLKAFKTSEDFFHKIYLKNQDFVGGNGINVCDLIASATFEQALLCEFEYDSRTKKYLSRCQERIEGYEDLLSDLRSLPELLKKLN